MPSCNRIFAGLLLVMLAVTNSCDRRAEASAKVRIEFWTIDLRLRFSDYIESLVSRYEKEHPNVDVVWVDVPFTAMVRKYISAAAAGRAPDVVNLSDGFYARFTALGGVRDLSELVPRDTQAAYLPGAMKLCRIDDRLYALPWYLATPLLFVNESLLAEGGLTPKTLAVDYAGLLKQAEAFHAKTGKFLFCPMLGHESELPTKLLGEGLIPFRAKANGKGIEANLTDPRIVAMIENWVRLYRKGVFPREAATSSHGAIIDLYQNGRVAILATGPQMLERVRDAAPDIFAKTQVMHPIMGAIGKPGIQTMLLCVSSQSQHPKEAADFAAFVTNASNQLEFCRRVSILPSTIASLDDPFFTKLPAGDDKIAEAKAMSAQLVRTGVNHTPSLATWPELTGVFQEKIKLALTDGRDVKETLGEIEGEWNRILHAGVPVSMNVMK